MKELTVKPQLDTVDGIEVMKSTDLHKVVFNNTGKYEKLSHLHQKIKKILINQSSPDLGSSISAVYRENGSVKYYNLTEVECNMVMAKVDINHLRVISEVFVGVKNNLPQLVDNSLALAQIELKKLELTEKTKQMEIEAKVKLGRKKTGIRRIPNCPQGYNHMKAFERSLEDVGEPIPLSFLKATLVSYATSIDTRGNCINIDQFNSVLDSVFDSFVEEGAYQIDTEKDNRVLTSKISWYF